MTVAIFIIAQQPAYSQRSAARAPDPVVVQAARVVGVRQCLGGVSATAKRIMQGAVRQDILLDWDHDAPDRGPLFSMTGLEFPNGQIAVVALNAVPTANGRCTMLAERISTIQKSCAEVARQEMQGANSTVLLPSIMVYTRPGQPLESYSLVSTTANSCLIIRRQAVFNWTAQQG